MPKTKLPKIIFLAVFLAAGSLALPKISHAANVFQLFPGVQIFQGQSLNVFRPWVCGTDTVTYGGQTYNTVLIGSQCWFKENLNVGTMIGSKLADNSTLQNQTDNASIEKYCYGYVDHDDAAQIATGTANCSTDGGLYQWAEAVQYAAGSSCTASNTGSCQPTEPVQGICPTGWHVPTDDNIKTLEEYLGMCSGTGAGCSGATGYRGTDQGSRLAGNPGGVATNHANSWNGTTVSTIESDIDFGSSGFNGLPAGSRSTDGSFFSRSDYTRFWSASQISATDAWYRYLYYGNATVYRNFNTKAYGFSVRCLKN